MVRAAEVGEVELMGFNDELSVREDESKEDYRVLKICSFVCSFVGENGVKLHFYFEMPVEDVQGVYETEVPKEVKRLRETWGSLWWLKPCGWLRPSRGECH